MERLILKYGNRKLYDKSTKKYVNLDQLVSLVNQDEQLKVIDYKTKKDITYDVLVSVLSLQLLSKQNSNVNDIINLIKQG